MGRDKAQLPFRGATLSETIAAAVRNAAGSAVLVGNPALGGIPDRYPQITWMLTHMGGALPYLAERCDRGYEAFADCRRHISKPPSDYFKQFYADTALFGAAPATECGLEFFGVDKVLFATDMPFDPKPGLYARETIRIIEGLGLSAADKEKIYRGNAEKLLKIESKVPA